MAAQRADAHAEAVDRNGARGAEDLVGFRLPFPLFAALAVVELLVDPRDQAAGQRHAEVVGRQRAGAGQLGDAALNVENGGRRILQRGSDVVMQHAHLGQQFAHMARAAAGRRLIGGDGGPFHQILGKQAAQRHQHQANGAVTADEGLDAFVETLTNHLMVHRIENNDGVVFHAQRRGRVNPVALPAAGAQLRVDFTGIIAALAGDNDIQRLERLNIKRILQRTGGLAAKRRRSLSQLRGGEEDRIDNVKITLFAHARHQHGADHTAPTNKTYILHFLSVSVSDKGRPAYRREERNGFSLRSAS